MSTDLTIYNNLYIDDVGFKLTYIQKEEKRHFNVKILNLFLLRNYKLCFLLILKKKNHRNVF